MQKKDYAEEEALCKDFDSCTFITDFPLRTHPFWNMKHKGDGLYSKVDVIMHGIETIGSAERSCDKESMRQMFNSISNGEYANTLYAQFSKERVQKEMNAKYLKKEKKKKRDLERNKKL